MSLLETEKLTSEEVAVIQAQNTADFKLAEKLNRQEATETGLTGLENSSASADIDED